MISKIKIPNLRETLMLTAKTVARFPLATLCGIVGTIAMCYYVEVDYQNDDLQKKLMKIVMVSGLGISFFTALQLFGEHLKSRALHYAIQLLGLVLLLLYYFSLPLELKVVHGVRFVLFGLVAHLLVSFAPFIIHFKRPGFWSYNKQLFLQILTAFFFSMVLFAGLALAFLAVEKLFDVDIRDKTYSKLFFIISGIFSMLYFLGGVPKKEEVFQDEEAYSKGLSIFTQYILIPLVGIYNIILYLYTFKIIIQWDWPRGWIAYLFVSYSVLGILSYLLIYPVVAEKSKVWLRIFAKGFFISLIPLIVVLFLAVYLRASEYGLTENRYFLFVLDFWLFGIGAYFIFSKSGNIKLIPLTLAVVILLTSFGPWGAFSMSINNQVSRFEKIFNEKVKGPEEKQFEDQKNLSSILTYLMRRESLDEVQGYFKHDIDSLRKEKYVSIENLLLQEYNLEYVNEWADEGNTLRRYFSFTTRTNYVADINHAVFLRFEDYQKSNYKGVAIEIDKDELLINMSDSVGWEAQISIKSLVQDLAKLNNSYVYDMEPEKMALHGENEAISYSLYVHSLYVERVADGQFALQNIGFDLFFTKRK
ncbi:DUF4153 domain-containing protein [Fulvivirga kasyanovii]|uniref:DUF4153 domain-containing protein n=1 Tax=Fulvivirga kasyanovii TaxID=396812 RepID=A0ABW9RKK2_9BACT|nr:DUF4153 domain-containing protein [Fulvivirga kasyanovii]MTI23765.1 DUF4153 domain-containing protein [Fulvivirga kasyanovii]